MDRDARIIMMKTACDAMSAACDNLSQAAKAFYATREHFRETISAVVGDRCEELRQFEATWKTEWEEKWGFEWEYVGDPRSRAITFDEKNTERLIAHRKELRSECELENNAIDEANEKIDLLETMTWKFGY